MKKFISVILLSAMLLTACGNNASTENQEQSTAASVEETEAVSSVASYEDTEASSSFVSSAETTLQPITEAVTSPNTNDSAMKFLKGIDRRFYDYALFCDIDLDGNNELLFAASDDKSFATMIYSVYKLNEEVPQLYGRIDLESGQSEYSEHTVCGGKLQRYCNSEKGVYVIISDATRWDDGSFGNLQYRVIENTLYSDSIENETLSEFSGTPCIPAQYIRDNRTTDYSYIDKWEFVYCNDILDLSGTEKFADISDVTEKYEFVDTIDLDSLNKYQDIDEIAELISEYSGYENTNKVSAPDDDNEYIGIVGMGNHKICKSDTDVAIEIRDIAELDWNKILEIDDLHSLVLHYYGDEAIDIDLSALKKYQNLTVISLPDNITENTKQQISELTTLEYVNKWDIIISSEEDFEYIKDLPNLKYIAVASDNDDPDYFEFLYDNQSIEWIRFAESVTDEQVKRTVDNMPNLKAVTFGFSEV